MNQTTLAPRLITVYCVVALYLFAQLTLVIPSKYSIGAALLLFGGIYAYIKDYHRTIDGKTLLVLVSLVLFSLEGFVNVLWHQIPSTPFEKTVRFMYAVPVFFLIRWAKPSLKAVWLGVAGGAIAAGGIAIFEKFILHMDRAQSVTHPIQFGNLSLLLGLFCVAGLAWASTLGSSKQRKRYYVLLLCGGLGGLVASLLSGSRGGWVGLPLVLWVLFKAYHSLLSIRTKVTLFSVIIVGVVAVFYTPQLHVKERVQAAFNDIQLYQQGDAHTSLGARLEMWSGAVQLIKEKPLMGWGREEYKPAMAQLAEQGRISPVVTGFDHAHNELLDKLAKHGVVGLLVLVLLYLVPIGYFSPYLRHADMSVRAVATAGVLLPVAYIDFGLSQSLFAHDNGVMSYSFWLVIWTAYLNNLIDSKQ